MIKSCAQSDVELSVEKLSCVYRAEGLPLQIKDCSQPEEEADKPGAVKDGQEERLNGTAQPGRKVLGHISDGCGR